MSPVAATSSPSVGLCGLVDGDDRKSLGFVRKRGFLEIARRVEQIRVLGAEPWPAPPPSIELQELRSEYLRGSAQSQLTRRATWL
jgi:hypothetical protein